MQKVTLVLISFLMSLILFGQKNHTQLDENGCSFRSLNNQYNLEVLKQYKGPNAWSSIGPYGGDVMDMAVNPLDPNIVFAAAGIPYISYDGGETWTYIEALSNLASSIETFEASPSGIIYASGPYSYYKIFRSTDGGETWEQKSIPVNGAGLDIAIDPNDPNVIYMGLSSGSGS
ncbi:MAG: hypothetical protein K8R74_17495, partial [Bacteroidales bacterium]|nr:hypothetical protein [Bacteroidales bacterium]